MKPHAWTLWLVVGLLGTVGALVVSRGWAEKTHEVVPKTGEVEKNFEIDKKDAEPVSPESVDDTLAGGKIKITTKTFTPPTGGWKFKKFTRDLTPTEPYDRRPFNPGEYVDIEIDPQCLPPVVEAPTVQVKGPPPARENPDEIKVVVTDLTVPTTVGWPLKCEGNLNPPGGGGGGGKEEWHWSAKVRLLKVEIYKVEDKEDHDVTGEVFDAKIKGPAEIFFRIIGTDDVLDLDEATIRFYDDPEDEAHDVFYDEGTPGEETLVRTLTATGAQITRVGTGNAWKVSWDGCADTPDERLLLAGMFNLKAQVEVTETDTTLVSDKFAQEIAEPHSGHFCGDFPRSSVYNISELPGGGSLVFSSDEPDYDEQDSIYPTLQTVYDQDADGFWWWLKMRFHYKASDDVWLVYTPESWPLEKGKKEKEIESTSAVKLTVEQIKHSSYPASRLAFIAKYNGTDYDVYRDAPFYSPEDYTDTGNNLTPGTAEWFSYDGSEDEDIQLKITQSEVPEVGAEVAILVFPKVNGENGVYNDSANVNNLMEVDLDGFDVADGDTFDLRLFRGYGVRKFWDESIGSRNRKGGVDHSADALNANGFDAKGYDRTDPGSDSDYGNLDRDAAIQEWEDKLALVEISTHASTGHIGWYVGTYNTGEGAVNGKEQELYDSDHRQSYYATDVITDQDLDDVFVFIAGGCDTYGEPEKEGKESIPTVLKNRGVDAVLSWDKSQYPARHLWVKYFLEMSFVKGEGGEYPTMLEAAVDARDELVGDFDQDTANYVYNNLKWDGKVANPQNQKLFPPRYGRKDN